MQGTREIRRRIRSVKNTQQITRAMKMVAAARLRKAQERVLAARPFARTMREVFLDLMSKTTVTNPLMAERGRNKRVLYVVITGDRGLSGGYNANILRKALGHAKDVEEASFIAVGKKGRDYLRFRKLKIAGEHVQLGDEPQFMVARQILDQVSRSFINNEVDEVYLVYSQFVTAMTQRPVANRLLPLAAPVGEKAGEAGSAAGAAGAAGMPGTPAAEGGPGYILPEYIYEPSAEAILARLIPKYLETLIFHGMLEGKAGEFGARMTAMDMATNNAAEMIDRLTLQYNRARQASITKEINEIVGGANALQ